MDRRLQLHELLLTFCNNVYFQEPERQGMTYPAILYQPDYEVRKHANNATYDLIDRWQVTIMDHDPDSEIRQRLRMVPMCVFDRHFRTQGLNHFIYSLYY